MGILGENHVIHEFWNLGKGWYMLMWNDIVIFNFWLIYIQY